MKPKLKYGVGINDTDYEIIKNEKVGGKWKITWVCPYYAKWCGMLSRCYCMKYQEGMPTYKGCTVCEEWLTFSNFRKWMEKQNWEGWCLDKDFLVEGNKVYSPATCVFIPQGLNKFTLTRAKTRGKYPIGVSYRKKSKLMVNEYSKPYLSLINNQIGRQIYLGTYSTPEEAHLVYLKAKLCQCADYLEEFKGEVLIVKGLTRIRSKIEYHINSNLELTSF